MMELYTLFTLYIRLNTVRGFTSQVSFPFPYVTMTTPRTEITLIV